MKTTKCLLNAGIKKFKIAILFNLLIINYIYTQKIDSVYIYETNSKPVIDGLGNDICWQQVSWNYIDHVWINYGEEIDSADFYGRFKIVWSSTDNLLYFLVEITDDAAIGGYIPGQTAAIYNYDILEVFIDENKSGGPHISDDPVTGENAENAFGYHIYIDFPAHNVVNNIPIVEDIPRQYNEHFPEFAIRGSNDFYTREFSLQVYNDTYDAQNPESSRVQIKAGNLMGLSLAYCDNDEDDGLRDNFFGSVWVPSENYNDHWMNADYFCPAVLKTINTSNVVGSNTNENIKVFQKLSEKKLHITGDDRILKTSIYNSSGNLLLEADNNMPNIDLAGFSSGLYLVHVVTKTSEIIRKILIY